MKNWSLTDKLVTFIGELIKSSNFAQTGASYYPWIGWTLGGTKTGPNGLAEPMEPKYGVGLVQKNNISPEQIRVSSKSFGYVIFSPNPEDEGSPRRLIDFDGTKIVVR